MSDEGQKKHKNLRLRITKENAEKRAENRRKANAWQEMKNTSHEASGRKKKGVNARQKTAVDKMNQAIEENYQHKIDGDETFTYHKDFEKLALAHFINGGTAADLCRNLGIRDDTFQNWFHTRRNFRDAVQKGKDFFASNIAEQKLFELVSGSEVTEVHQGVSSKGPFKKTITKKIKPEFSAIEFFLLNRSSERWKRSANQPFTIADYSDDEIDALIGLDIIDMHENKKGQYVADEDAGDEDKEENDNKEDREG